MLAIKNNLMAENAARQLGKSYDALAKSVERLSSGLRINSAKDDAAGLAVRELIRADVAALHQGSRNARDAISMLQAAEGGLSMVDDILVRMRELAEQAATGSYSIDQVQIMQQEFSELMDEIDRIAENTKFNGNNLLDNDDENAVTIALGGGLEATQVIQIDKHDVSSEGLGLGKAKEFDITKFTVSSASESKFISNNAGANSGANNGTLTWDFGEENSSGVAKNIQITIVENTEYTLAEIVSMINTDSQAKLGYNAAEAIYSGATKQWLLKVSARDAGNTATHTITEGGATADLQWGTKAGGTDFAATLTNDFTSVDGTETAVSIALDPDAAIDALDDAIKEKDVFRAHLGYMMNRLEAATAVIDIQSENLLTAESRVSDVDVATEMARFTRNQVLAQAGISMLAQANTMPQMALQLLS